MHQICVCILTYMQDGLVITRHNKSSLVITMEHDTYYCKSKIKDSWMSSCKFKYKQDNKKI